MVVGLGGCVVTGGRVVAGGAVVTGCTGVVPGGGIVVTGGEVDDPSSAAIVAPSGDPMPQQGFGA